eukprot:TRINITY_DN18658_c0_g1_i1.p1 TRINITY_DN18658_c0_g1~~TRINITY_DN18658_c0_g1_i1.p1  ORF type:complete len:817 (-),score=115.53 TRINITY_DN18658_c0_g1_i1:184-2634(-)
MVVDKDYNILCTLGEGSFGKVYKAEHRKSGDIVAVKQIKLGSKSWEEALRSTELQALKTLRHPFIVRLRELLRAPKDGSLYFIFEFVDSDLCKAMKKYPNGLAEPRAADWTRQLFAGIAHMHQHNFFHRDLKPENVLFNTSKETVRIADFGTCRAVRARPPFTEYVGTRWYRAPECLLRDSAYSTPVDVWASGLIFAELLRGSPAFMGTSSVDQLYKAVVVLGQPKAGDWPEFQRLAQAVRFRPPEGSGCGLHRIVPNASTQAMALLTETLALNPRRRPLARKCLEHPCFAQLPPLNFERNDSRPTEPSGRASPAVSDQPTSEAGDIPGTQPQSARVSIDERSVVETEPEEKAELGLGQLKRAASRDIPTAATTPRVPADDASDDVDLDAMLDDVLGDDTLETPRPDTKHGLETTAVPLSSTALFASINGRTAAPLPDASQGSHHFGFGPEARCMNSGQPAAGAEDIQQAPPTKCLAAATVGRTVERAGSLDDLLDGLLDEIPGQAKSSCASSKPRHAEPRARDTGAEPHSSSLCLPVREDFMASTDGFDGLPAPSELGVTGLGLTAALQPGSGTLQAHQGLSLSGATALGPNLRTAMLPEGLGRSNAVNLRTALLVEDLGPVDSGEDSVTVARSKTMPLAEVTLERPSSGRKLMKAPTDSFAQQLVGDRSKRPAPVARPSAAGAAIFADVPIREVSFGSSDSGAEARESQPHSAAVGDNAKSIDRDFATNSPDVCSKAGASSTQDLHRSSFRPFSEEEALKLRRIVKRVIKGGTRDKEALWEEVAAALGGRSPKECKVQYARDYKAHKGEKAKQK